MFNSLRKNRVNLSPAIKFGFFDYVDSNSAVYQARKKWTKRFPIEEIQEIL